MTDKKISRREFLTMAGAGAAGAFLATKLPASVAEATKVAVPSPKEPVTIEFWHFNWGELLNQPVKDFADKFNKENTEGITIKIFFNDDNATKSLTALAAGTGPDIIEIENNAAGAAELYDTGVMVDLAEYMDAAGISEDAYVPQCVQNKYKGKWYDLPGTANYQALWYNVEIIKEAGINPEEDFATLEGFREVQEKLFKQDSAGNLTQVGAVPGSYAFLSFGDWYMFGGNLSDEEGNPTLNTPERVETLEYLMRWKELVDIPTAQTLIQSSAFGGASGAPAAVANRLLSVWMDGFWGWPGIDEIAPDVKYAIMHFPTKHGKDDWMAWTWGIGITNLSKHPDAGWAYAKYILWDHIAEYGARTLAGAPPQDDDAIWKEFNELCIKIALEKKPDSSYPAYVKVFEEGGRQARLVIPNTLAMSVVQDAWSKARDVAVREDRPAKDILDEVQKLAETQLKK